MLELEISLVQPSLACLFVLGTSLLNCVKMFLLLMLSFTPQSSSLMFAGCCSCLQKASSAPIGQVGMKSTPSSGKLQIGRSCFPPGAPFKSLLGLQAALTYLQVILSKSEVVMQFVTASEMRGQQHTAKPCHITISETCNRATSVTLRPKKSSCTKKVLMQGQNDATSPASVASRVHVFIVCPSLYTLNRNTMR